MLSDITIVSKHFFFFFCFRSPATLGAMVVGTILGWTSSAQLLLPQSAKFDVTDEDALSYGPVFALGALGGCIEAGLMLNTIGYRYSIAIYEALVAVGWVILTVPTSKIMLSAGRILQGLGVGGLCAVIPLYVGETSQPKIRGGFLRVKTVTLYVNFPILHELNRVMYSTE